MAVRAATSPEVRRSVIQTRRGYVSVNSNAATTCSLLTETVRRGRRDEGGCGDFFAAVLGDHVVVAVHFHVQPYRTVASQAHSGDRADRHHLSGREQQSETPVVRHRARHEPRRQQFLGVGDPTVFGSVARNRCATPVVSFLVRATQAPQKSGPATSL